MNIAEILHGVRKVNEVRVNVRPRSKLVMTLELDRLEVNLRSDPLMSERLPTPIPIVSDVPPVLVIRHIGRPWSPLT